MAKTNNKRRKFHLRAVLFRTGDFAVSDMVKFFKALPQDAICKRIFERSDSMTYFVIIEHPSFDPIWEGDLIPRYTVLVDESEGTQKLIPEF